MRKKLKLNLQYYDNKDIRFKVKGLSPKEIKELFFHLLTEIDKSILEKIKKDSE